MAIELTMPKLSDTMEEGKIIKWLVKEGDSVASGDVLAEIETDKADMEFETIDEGVILKILVPEGDRVKVGTLIAIVGEAGEEVASPAPAAKETKAEPAPTSKPEPEPAPAAAAEEVEEESETSRPSVAQAPVASAGGAKVSPVARKLADEAGIDISTVKGTGPEGRIIKRDIEQLLGGAVPATAPQKAAAPAPAAKPAAAPAKATPTPAPAPAKLTGRREEMSSMRRTIARRLVESKVTVPHFYLTIEIDMAPVMTARELIQQEDGIKLSVNDFVVKACAKALLSHPLVNAHIEGDEIVYHDSVDIGVAVALEEGLITPYVRAAHTRSLLQINEEVKGLANRARERKLKPEEYSGGSFTISNLGMFGIDQFTAIINPPESTILAVGRSREVPVVVEGALAVGTRMSVTLSCDHRIVDGAVGAKFLATLKEILEHPTRLLV